MTEFEDRPLTAWEQACIDEFGRRLREVGDRRWALLNNSSFFQGLVTPELRSALTRNDSEHEVVMDWLRSVLPDTESA